MKKSTFLTCSLLVLFATVLSYGCSKDKDDDSPSKRILGLWNIIRETEIYKNTSTGKYTDTAYSDAIAPGLFTAEFRGNGKLYISINTSSPSKDTLDWHFHNNNTLSIDDELANVEVFTNNRIVSVDYYWDNTDSVKHILEFTK